MNDEIDIINDDNINDEIVTIDNVYDTDNTITYGFSVKFVPHFNKLVAFSCATEGVLSFKNFSLTASTYYISLENPFKIKSTPKYLVGSLKGKIEINENFYLKAIYSNDLFRSFGATDETNEIQHLNKISGFFGSKIPFYLIAELGYSSYDF